jgi:hypothetical protein
MGWGLGFGIELSSFYDVDVDDTETTLAHSWTNVFPDQIGLDETKKKLLYYEC